MNLASALLELLTVAVALAIVLGLAFFSLKLLKRLQAGAPSDDQIRYLRALPVGQRERLTLVAYRDEVFLLGVTAGQITVLDRRTRTAEELAAEATAAELARRRAAQPSMAMRQLIGKTLARERPDF
ncbi:MULTISPECIES: flagellar biosynthetic protein FliO [Caulobacter]|uniref:Flagellar protein n=1 Tax=Caulobacter rhizosphaerae TaxID=2010972 RepID=A0ABU1N271_9CAUL|nr:MULTISPECIES: flagellar biosynthetic protein FliO [Caulobacter]MDR6532540.1 flagellar biosynthetic protein FliO [Caulobacter rhizosphaerae]